MMEKNMNQTKKCEYCSKDINIHIKVCPFWGGEVRDILEKELLPLCPRCRVSLESHTRDGEKYNTDKTTLAWNDGTAAHGSGTTYDLMRGRVDQLPVGSGASEVCGYTSLSVTEQSLPGAPLPGQAHYYLGRMTNACGNGSFGNATSGPRIFTGCDQP